MVASGDEVIEKTSWSVTTTKMLIAFYKDNCLLWNKDHKDIWKENSSKKGPDPSFVNHKIFRSLFMIGWNPQSKFRTYSMKFLFLLTFGLSIPWSIHFVCTSLHTVPVTCILCIQTKGLVPTSSPAACPPSVYWPSSSLHASKLCCLRKCFMMWQFLPDTSIVWTCVSPSTWSPNGSKQLVYCHSCCYQETGKELSRITWSLWL